MRKRYIVAMLLAVTWLLNSMAIAQVPTELFAGHKKATLDLMFFKFLKNKSAQASRFLFFNRNRVAIDYTMTSTSNLPQFGFTEAISYNHEQLKGFAPVIVASILNKGVSPKAGIQYAITKKDYTIFSWLVTETLKDPNIDFFVLGRYTPKLSSRLRLFSQLELVHSFPTATQNNFSFTQRLRLGLKTSLYQFGIGIDLAEAGRNNLTTTENFGGFLRYEF